jgi:hypothetical protein
MTSLQGTSPAAPPAFSARAETAVDALVFHLDYLDAKLTAIGEDFAEDISVEHAHELHSASDEVQQAREALARLRAQPATDTHPARGAAVVDFDEFTARWDRANEPISALISDRPAYAVAEWGAARARYELAFVEAVRPAAMGHAQRVERLDEAAAQLDRACRALEEHRLLAPPRRPARQRR